MTPTKVLLGQILVVLGVAIFGVWISTEWCAARLGFQPALGAANTFMLGVPIYAPWRLFVWWHFFDAYAPSVFNQAGLLAATSGLLGCASAIVGSVWRARQSRPGTPTARRAGPNAVRSPAPGSSAPRACSWSGLVVDTCATTALSTSWPLRAPGRARGWAGKRF